MLIRISIIILLSSAVFLSGCSSKAKIKKRYHLKHDCAPGHHEIPANLAKIPNAIPKDEPISKYGNPPKYRVLNKTYRVMQSSKGYKARGRASWYGKKFHGYRTSSGDNYDMFAMTAAHCTLPLPTYLKVKNVGNGREVIVKVNDRGPFHGDRLIDLSYVAAAKLGMLGHGTTHVEVAAIDPKEFKKHKYNHQQDNKHDHIMLANTVVKQQPKIDNNKKYYLQLGTFSEFKNAEKLRNAAKNIASSKNSIQIISNSHKSKTVFKVRLGPINSKEEYHQLKAKLLAANFPEPIAVHEPG